MDTSPLPPPIPTSPLETAPPPLNGYPTRAERRAWLDHVLRGVPLGAHDERIVEWLAGWDESTTLTVASLIERARAAELAEFGAEVVRGVEQCARCRSAL
jgi:hypothetical protein